MAPDLDPRKMPARPTPDPEARTKLPARPTPDPEPRAKSATRPPPAPDPDAGRGRSSSPPAAIPVTPPVRPLQARNLPTPVPQVVVAPFSSTPRAKTAPPTGIPTPPPGSFPPGVPMPPMRPTPAPGNFPQPSGHVPTPPGTPSYPGPNPYAPPGHVPTPPGTPPYSGNPFAVPGSNPSANPFAVPGSNPFLPTTPGSNPFASPLPGAPPAMPRPQYDMTRMAAREAMIRRITWIIALVVAAVIGFVIAMRL
jgi:hypothetical protein